MPNDDPQARTPSAIEVAEHCPLSDEARALLGPDVAPGAYIAQLISLEKYADAIRFTAFNLSRREAVWWATLCLWNASRNEGDSPLPKPVDDVFTTVVAWLQEPSEARRRAVESAGRGAGTTTPHGQLAMAAFCSEGNMSLRDQPKVEPKPWLTAKNVTAVVLAASKMKKPPQVAAMQRSFLVLAAELTKGNVPWTSLEAAESTVPSA